MKFEIKTYKDGKLYEELSNFPVDFEFIYETNSSNIEPIMFLTEMPINIINHIIDNNLFDEFDKIEIYNNNNKLLYTFIKPHIVFNSNLHESSTGYMDDSCFTIWKYNIDDNPFIKARTIYKI